MSAAHDTSDLPHIDSLGGSKLCGLDEFGQGTYTTEGIIKIAEMLEANSSITALEYATHLHLSCNRHSSDSSPDGPAGYCWHPRTADALPGVGRSLQNNNLDESAKERLENAAGDRVKLLF